MPFNNFIKEGGTETVVRYLWKKCKCGAITDTLDINHCPACGSSRLNSVKLTPNEIEILAESRRVWTRHPDKVYDLISGNQK